MDLNVARFSTIIEGIVIGIIPLIPSSTAYLGLHLLATLGGGFVPASQALALDLYSARIIQTLERGAQKESAEAGKLFGAMSVVQGIACVVFFYLLPSSSAFQPTFLHIYL